MMDNYIIVAIQSKIEAEITNTFDFSSFMLITLNYE